MKHVLSVVLGIAIGIGGLYASALLSSRLQGDGFMGGTYFNQPLTLVGSSSNLKSLPREFVFASATTTNAGQPDGGSTVMQDIRTENADYVRLNIMAVGGTATSTFSVRQMVSQDGTNFFDVSPTSTDEALNNGTTTISVVPFSISFDPGTATTTISKLFNVYGASWTRFVLYGEDVSTDPNDGVQAWIEAINLQQY